MLCAHYDSRMESLADATSRAPGADDNASGVAAVLEVARLLAGVDLTDTVHFVAFSGEEQGLWGSTEYAAQLAAAGTPVHRLVNLDMVGVPPADGSVTVERDLGNVVATNDAGSATFGAVMAQAAADYTSLPVVLGPIYASDYMPFEARGWVTIGAFEGGSNPDYHRTTDDVGTLDHAYLTAVTRLTLATLLQVCLGAVAEASSGVDLFIRDSPTDTGSQPSPVPHWTSPDIWVRNDGGPRTTPTSGTSRRSTASRTTSTSVCTTAAPSTSPPARPASRSTGATPAPGWSGPPTSRPLGELVVTDPLPAGGSARVGPFPWTPAIVDHECLIAVARTPGDSAVPDVYPDALDHGLLVRYDNNVGQRNVAPVHEHARGQDDGAALGARRSGRRGRHPRARRHRCPGGHLATPPGAAARPRGAALEGLDEVARSTRWVTLALARRAAAAPSPASGSRRETGWPLELVVDFSVSAEHLRRYPVVVSQELDGMPAGKETVEITAVKEADDLVYGNARSHEVHVVTCPLWDRMTTSRLVPFLALGDALARGYDGCAFCVPHAHTG